MRFTSAGRYHADSSIRTLRCSVETDSSSKDILKKDENRATGDTPEAESDVKDELHQTSLQSEGTNSESAAAAQDGVIKETDSVLKSSSDAIDKSKEVTENSGIDEATRKRLEAERLDLEAKKAMLEFERKTLEAEKKKLELMKVRMTKDEFREKQNRISTLNAEVENAKDALNKDSAAAAEAPAGAVEKKTNGNNAGLNPATGMGSSPMLKEMTKLLENMNMRGFTVSEKDIALMKEKVLSMRNFYVTQVERSPFDSRVVFRGNLRMNPAEAMEDITKAAKACGVADRLALFLLVDPASQDKRPCVVALPADVAEPNKRTTASTVLAVVAAVATAFTTFSYGVSIFGISPEFVQQITQGNVDEVYYTLPVSIGAFAIAIFHEAGHRVSAAYHKVKLGLPYFLPSLQIGLYGTITPLGSYPKNRTQLFDVAISGPAAGLGLSLVGLVAGLVLTNTGAVADWWPQIPGGLFRASLLMGSIANIILPPGIREQATYAVHPLTVVGFTGVIVNALQLIPIGRLDGGRVVQSLFGRRIANIMTSLTLILQGLASILGNSPLLLFWGLVCVFLQREPDYSCQDDVTEPNNARTILGLSMLFIMLITLCPFPDSLRDVLGQY